MSTRKLALSALFICFAASLSALESMLPPIVPFAPMIRVGLGNTVTLFILYIGGKWRAADAYTVTILRCLLAALITGSPMHALYGTAGGLLACTAMLTARRLFPKRDGLPDERFLSFTGICGAVFHIAGQLLTAVIFYGTRFVLAYTPILLASAIIGGAFTGLCAMLVLRKMPSKVLDEIRK